MAHRKHYTLLLFLLPFFISCGQPPPPAVPRQPTSVIEKSGKRVEIYDFEAFKAFLQPPNDSLYVINFWATWCAPCVAELPHFEQLQQKYKDQATKVILVSLDFMNQIESKLIPFLNNKKLQSEVLVLDQKDVNKWLSNIDPHWSGALPATLICRGNKKRFYEQSFNYAELEAAIKSF